MAFATALIFAVPVLAAAAIYSNWLGKAIAGYDPVAFHTAGKPVEGVSNFTAEWKGANGKMSTVSINRIFLSVDPCQNLTQPTRTVSEPDHPPIRQLP